MGKRGKNNSSQQRQASGSTGANKKAKTVSKQKQDKQGEEPVVHQPQRSSSRLLARMSREDSSAEDESHGSNETGSQQRDNPDLQALEASLDDTLDDNSEDSPVSKNDLLGKTIYLTICGMATPAKASVTMKEPVLIDKTYHHETHLSVNSTIDMVQEEVQEILDKLSKPKELRNHDERNTKLFVRKEPQGNHDKMTPAKVSKKTQDLNTKDGWVNALTKIAHFDCADDEDSLGTEDNGIEGVYLDLVCCCVAKPKPKAAATTTSASRASNSSKTTVITILVNLFGPVEAHRSVKGEGDAATESIEYRVPDMQNRRIGSFEVSDEEEVSYRGIRTMAVKAAMEDDRYTDKLPSNPHLFIQRRGATRTFDKVVESLPILDKTNNRNARARDDNRSTPTESYYNVMLNVGLSRKKEEVQAKNPSTPVKDVSSQDVREGIFDLDSPVVKTVGETGKDRRQTQTNLTARINEFVDALYNNTTTCNPLYHGFSWEHKTFLVRSLKLWKKDGKAVDEFFELKVFGSL